MSRLLKSVSGFATVGLLVAGFAASLAPNAAANASEGLASLHLALSRTVPAADTTIANSPPEIRLIFTEAPQASTSSVRLTRGPETLVPTTTVAPDPVDTKQLFIRPNAPLTSGAYRVHWRVAAQDGHVQNGTFDFRISAD